MRKPSPFFKEEFLETEKNNLRKVIESKIDNKDKYAYDNCIAAMYKDEGFGIYKYGYIENFKHKISFKVD